MSWNGIFVLGFVFILISCSTPPSVQDSESPVAVYKGPKNYRGASRQLRKLYTEGQTFYCNCDFKGYRVNLEECSFKPKKKNARAYQVEFEHVVPSSLYGRQFAEWTLGHRDCRRKDGSRYKGRKCAGKFNAEYMRMNADLYNLRPVVGDVNLKRSNYEMADIKGEAREFGTCDIEFSKRTFEPPDDKKGDVARVYFYMAQAYPDRVTLSEEQKDRFEKWAESDPVSQAECRHYRKAQGVMGVDNPILAPSCPASAIAVETHRR